ncbi:methoxymalonate biosynthesis protein [Microbacterium sp. HM58-2]|nr:methoxymalonate biosynthesis protein [Microbacterium sp. HM58-2]
MRRTVAAAILTCGVGVMALTGCGPVNAGSAAADDIEAQFSEADGVASVEASGSNDLPFVGSVEATVTAEPGLSADRIDAIAEDLADHMSARDGIGWSVTLVADALTVGMTIDDAERALRLDIARELAEHPHAESVRVAVAYEDPVVLVEVDAPETLSEAYALARAAVDRLDVDGYHTNAGAVSGEFTIDDESRDGEETAIQVPLRIFDAVLARFPLTSATVTPEELELRAASEENVPQLEALVTTMPVPEELEIEIQGGRTTLAPDASAAADAVAAALRDVKEVSEISASGDFVNIVVDPIDDASTVLAAIEKSPDFLSLGGFGVRDPSLSFRVFDRPAELAATLAIAEAASVLPSLTSVDASRYDERPAPSLQLRFDGATEEMLAAFATTMKPALVAGGWDVWLNADGFVESFRAEDRITLEEPVTGDREQDEQRFADTLVRTWNDAATS